MTGAPSWSGINLTVIKYEGEIISDRLMELHHTLGHYTFLGEPKRHNDGGDQRYTGAICSFGAGVDPAL